jgi:hypothetical protein
MRDVAAGVSLMTVSRVVNGEPGVLPATHPAISANLRDSWKPDPDRLRVTVSRWCL